MDWWWYEEGISLSLSQKKEEDDFGKIPNTLSDNSN